jgi:hypothetical protein
VYQLYQEKLANKDNEPTPELPHIDRPFVRKLGRLLFPFIYCDRIEGVSSPPLKHRSLSALNGAEQPDKRHDVCHHEPLPPLCVEYRITVILILLRADNENPFWYIGVISCSKKTFQLHYSLHRRRTFFHLGGQLVKVLLSNGTNLHSRHLFRLQPEKSLDYIGGRCSMQDREDSTEGVGLRSRYAPCVDALPGQVSV